MNFFQTLKIKLVDHHKIYLYSIFDGLTETFDNTKYDIEMHSESLFFVFKNEFGFDTLTVNGCFESSQKGFSKLAKTNDFDEKPTKIWPNISKQNEQM